MEFHSGKEAGTTFEKLFERQCQLAGLWAEDHGIKAKRAWKGRLIELKSDLDYKVMGRGGRVAYVDCKTFDEPFFFYSSLVKKNDTHQIDLAVRYNEFGFQAGFVVWFRPINWVAFYPGWLIRERGPGTRFLPQDGKYLGTWSTFRPERLLPLGSPSGTVP